MRSTSAAWGAIRASANWRRVSRNWRCSSVRAKVESVMLPFSQSVGTPGLRLALPSVSGIRLRSTRRMESTAAELGGATVVVGDRGERLPAGGDQCPPGASTRNPHSASATCDVVDAGRPAEEGGPTGGDQGAPHEDVVLVLALRRASGRARSARARRRANPASGPGVPTPRPARAVGRPELGRAGPSSRPRGPGAGGPAAPGRPRLMGTKVGWVIGGQASASAPGPVQETEDDRVGEGLPGGLDDVLRHPDGGPGALAVGRCR